MDDRTPLATPASGLSDTQSDEAVAYRPVSTLAVLGCVVAAVSTLALVSPWFTGLPVIALLLSYAGARSVLSDPEARTGLPVALVGLALASAVLAATFVRGAVSARLHAADARPLVERFVAELGEGDVIAAFELTLPYAERHADPEAAAGFYDENQEAGETLERFAEQDAVQSLQAAEATYRGHADPQRAPGRLQSVWLYDAAGETFAIVIERPASPGRLGAAAWRVTSVRRADGDD